MVMDNDLYNMENERNPALEDKVTELVFLKFQLQMLNDCMFLRV